MTELKTLKYIQPKGIEEDGTISYGGYIPIRKLRNTAIEWLTTQNLDDWLNGLPCPLCGGELEYNYEGGYDCKKCDKYWYNPIQLWIMHFFNLSECDII